MSIDTAQERVGPVAGGRASRPEALGTHHAVAAGQPLAALAALRILEAGGNAVDAGVAGGLCLGVVHSDMVNVAGVAPIMIYDASRREVATISGVGPWPRRASVDFFRRECGGEIPSDIRRTVVPAAPDAWITALERYGTLGFAEVAAPAIELARDGFPVGPLHGGDPARPRPEARPLALERRRVPPRRPPAGRGAALGAGRPRPHAPVHGGRGPRGAEPRPRGRARGRARRVLQGGHRGGDRPLPRGAGGLARARGPGGVPGRGRARPADALRRLRGRGLPASGARALCSSRCSSSSAPWTSRASATTRRSTSTS